MSILWPWILPCLWSSMQRMFWTGQRHAWCHSSSNTNTPSQSKKKPRDDRKWCSSLEDMMEKHTDVIDVSGNHVLRWMRPTWLPCPWHPRVSTPNPDMIQINDTMIATMTEASMTFNLPADISPNKWGTLCCHIDSTASINVMPICVLELMTAQLNRPPLVSEA